MKKKAKLILRCRNIRILELKKEYFRRAPYGEMVAMEASYNDEKS